MAGSGARPQPGSSPAAQSYADDQSAAPSPAEVHVAPSGPPPARARFYRAAMLACGAALFAFLVISIGPATVVASFRLLSWRLVLLIVFPCIVLKSFDAHAWGFAFSRKPVPFRSLLASILAGQAVASPPPAWLLGRE